LNRLSSWSRRAADAWSRCRATWTRSCRWTAQLRTTGGAPSTATQDFVIGPHGGRIYVDLGDQRAAALLEANGDYNPLSHVMWRKLVAERAWTHIIDVGANYGEMLVGVAFPENAALIAIEPNPYLLPYLRRTVAEAGLAIELVAAAATDQNGMIALSIDRTWSGMSSVIGGQQQSQGHVLEVREIPATTLTSLVRERFKSVASLLVKIDVEGHEAAVLRGLNDLLPSLESFAALVEVLHLDDGDLGWILAHFDVALLDRQTNELATVEMKSAQDLRGALAAGRFYPQDVALRRKSAG
jgi:FkbM family methyltransferase